MNLTLERFKDDGERTLGNLAVGDRTFATVERPWIPSPDHRGGLNRQSCVPKGVYAIRPHHSVNFPNTYALFNPDLDVFYQPGDVPQGKSGRTAILIHVGNFVRSVVGCIAVGMEHGAIGGEPAVLRSVMAMRELDKILERGHHTLEIK